MRVRIIFNLKNRGALVPFHHQYLLAQLVDELLEDAANNYQEYRDYSFSGLKGQTKVARAGLSFYSSKVTLVFSSPNEQFVKEFLYRLFEREEISVGQLTLVPDSIAREEQQKFKERSCKYICISPLVLLSPELEENPKRFIPPDTDTFSDLLYESTMLRMERSGQYNPDDIASFYKFQVVPDQQYLDKLRREDRKFARIYPLYDGEEKKEIRGYTMPFVLHAEEAVHDFVYACGFGEVSYRGFGMLDLANSTAHLRARTFELDGYRRRENVVPLTPQQPNQQVAAQRNNRDDISDE